MKKYRSFSKGNSMNGSSITSAGRKKKKDTNEETFTQASLYVTAYFLCYIFVVIAQFQDEVGFVMMLLKGIQLRKRKSGILFMITKNLMVSGLKKRRENHQKEETHQRLHKLKVNKALNQSLKKTKTWLLFQFLQKHKKSREITCLK